jgi:DNA-binding PadR family transcriptional regulator
MSAREKKPDRLPTLSAKEALILQMLVPKRHMYGQEMVEASDGQLGRGTVYVTLDRMEDKGYVDSWQEERAPGAVGLPRRLYKVTGLGSAVLREWTRVARVFGVPLLGSAS